jgi:hypothetical protein
MKTIEDTVLNILSISERSLMPLANRMIKLGEEVGELSEAVNHHLGWLPHKTMKEPLIGEVSDVIICALDVLRASYADGVSDADVIKLLNYYLESKSAKWDSIMPKADICTNAAPDK